MKTPQPVPAGYVKLEFGTGVVLREGDGVMWDWSLPDKPDLKIQNWYGRSIDGHGMAPMSSQSFYYVRPIAPQGWISVKDRQPTLADYGPRLEILGVYKDGKIAIFKYVDDGSGPEFQPWQEVTHWMPIPPRPQKPAIEVGEHLVTFHKDGSLKVGCTEVSSELFEQISERRKEEMQ